MGKLVLLHLLKQVVHDDGLLDANFFIQPKQYIFMVLWLDKIFYSAKMRYFYGVLAE